jgi:hypothetical protein
MIRFAWMALALVACNGANPGTGSDGGSDGSACMSSAVRPPGRKDVDAVLVPSSGKIVVFGGDVAPFSTALPAPRQLVDDLWRYDVACGTWENLGAGQAPGPRAAYAAALDTKRNRMLVVAGRAGTGTSPPLVNDVWAMDVATLAWTKLAPSGTAPSPRVGHRVIYDPDNDRLVGFGGDTSKTFGSGIIGDTWELGFASGADGAWKQLVAGGAAGAPTPRRDVAMAFDAQRKLAIIFGGATTFSDYLDEVWAFDLAANTWRMLTNAGAVPSSRFAAKIGYDAGHDRYILFGGHDAGLLGAQNDTTALALDAGATTATFTSLLTGDTDIMVGSIDKNSPERREKHALVATGSSIWVYAGAGDCGPLDDVWTLPLDQPTAWSPVFPAMIGETCQRRAAPGMSCQPPPNDCTAPF